MIWSPRRPPATPSRPNGTGSSAVSRSDRVVLAADWQLGDRYLRAGLLGSVLDRDGFGRVVMLDCFTADSAPQLIDAELLRPA
jgi:hypothetical protein